MNIKGASDEISEGNQEHGIGNWNKRDPCYIVTGNLAEFCSVVVWEAEKQNL